MGLVVPQVHTGVGLVGHSTDVSIQSLVVGNINNGVVAVVVDGHDCCNLPK